jgi:hypothetical protein
MRVEFRATALSGWTHWLETPSKYFHASSSKTGPDTAPVAPAVSARRGRVSVLGAAARGGCSKGSPGAHALCRAAAAAPVAAARPTTASCSEGARGKQGPRGGG